MKIFYPKNKNSMYKKRCKKKAFFNNKSKLVKS